MAASITASITASIAASIAALLITVLPRTTLLMALMQNRPQRFVLLPCHIEPNQKKGNPKTPRNMFFWTLFVVASLSTAAALRITSAANVRAIAGLQRTQRTSLRATLAQDWSATEGMATEHLIDEEMVVDDLSASLLADRCIEEAHRLFNSKANWKSVDVMDPNIKVETSP